LAVWARPVRYLISLPVTSRAFCEAVLPASRPTGLDAHIPTVRCVYPPASPHPYNGYQVVSEFQPIVHRLRSSPRLRSRLTLGGRAFPRNPWVFGGQDSHLPSRLLMPAFSLLYAPPLFSVRLRRLQNAPLPYEK